MKKIYIWSFFIAVVSYLLRSLIMLSFESIAEMILNTFSNLPELYYALIILLMTFIIYPLFIIGIPIICTLILYRWTDGSKSKLDVFFNFFGVYCIVWLLVMPFIGLLFTIIGIPFGVNPFGINIL